MPPGHQTLWARKNGNKVDVMARVDPKLRGQPRRFLVVTEELDKDLSVPPEFTHLASFRYGNKPVKVAHVFEE